MYASAMGRVREWAALQTIGFSRGALLLGAGPGGSVAGIGGHVAGDGDCIVWPPECGGSFHEGGPLNWLSMGRASFWSVGSVWPWAWWSDSSGIAGVRMPIVEGLKGGVGPKKSPTGGEFAAHAARPISGKQGRHADECREIKFCGWPRFASAGCPDAGTGRRCPDGGDRRGPLFVVGNHPGMRKRSSPFTRRPKMNVTWSSSARSGGDLIRGLRAGSVQHR
ncbi:MAG: hypothetical protein Ct9H300mP1_39140 [Planctomycetaceae bacterium]|nr:MAG: hypothetical protein Ct9H300mP1_39140 [Planctomycetaceae bacterium]